MTKKVVSVSCKSGDCAKMMDQIIAGTETLNSLKKKAYAQSLLESLKGIEAPKFDQFDDVKNYSLGGARFYRANDRYNPQEKLKSLV